MDMVSKLRGTLTRQDGVSDGHPYVTNTRTSDEANKAGVKIKK